MAVISGILAKIVALLGILASSLGLMVAHPAPVATATSTSATTTAAGSPIVTRSIWQTYSVPGWNIGFSYEYEPRWDVEVYKGDDGLDDQVAMSGETSTVFISKNLPISQSSTSAFTTSMRTIAGTQTEIRRYDHPNAQYAYYLYFAVPSRGDTYYFYFRSATSSMAVANDFMDLITH